MEKRKSPRININSPYSIVHQHETQSLLKNIVISKNLSATGFCFKSLTTLEVGSKILISFKHQNLEELGFEIENVLRMGPYFLAKIERCQAFSADKNSFFEIGCRFLEKREGDDESLKTLTQFINHLTWQEMAYED